MESRKKCNNIYWNLVELLDKYTEIKPTSYVRELMETTRCDKYNDLSQLRTDIIHRVGSS